MTKGNSRIVEHVFGLYYMSSEVVMLKIELHHGSPKMVKVEVGFYYRCLNSNKIVS